MKSCRLKTILEAIGGVPTITDRHITVYGVEWQCVCGVTVTCVLVRKTILMKCMCCAVMPHYNFMLSVRFSFNFFCMCVLEFVLCVSYMLENGR